MRRAIVLTTLLAVASCADEGDGAGGATTAATGAKASSATATAATATAASSASTGTAAGTLGLNDVSILVPLPEGATPVLFAASDPTAEATAILPRAVHDLALAIPDRPDELGDYYDDLELVAIRFDLCDRVDPTPCPAGADGSLRLVFQPIIGSTGVDLGFHAFFTVPAGEVPSMVERLRALAALRGAAPAILSPAAPLAEPGAYHDGVKELVSDLARGSRLVRVTTMGQVLIAAAFRWVFHGVEKRDGAFVEMTIPDVPGPVEDVLLVADASYRLTPAVDVPTGLALALQQSDFDGASDGARTAAMRVLLDVENPDVHTASTVQCPACHVSTVALARRAASLGLDPSTLPGRYQAPFDLSIAAGGSAGDDEIIHGFGWVSGVPAISQRVVNESAKVALEMEQRYPATGASP